ncbi:aminopeptidase [Peptococcaceae bacterium 1198_IL3148]
METTMLERYAKLIVEIGVNIQQDQTLVITSPIECADFTRLVADFAYQAGARDVVIQWQDELFSHLRYLKAPEAVFTEFPKWRQEFYLSYVRAGAAFLRIAANDPELMKDVNPLRMAKAQKASSAALVEYNDRLMSNKNTWCVVSVPTKAWAQKVFPHLSAEQAMEKLWQAIFKTVRVDTADPVVAWEQHKSQLKKRLDFLNGRRFKILHFQNSLGTDLTIELPEDHIWFGGSDYTLDKVEFVANIPTEEVYTLPLKTGVNGTVVSSMPLNYNGNIVENFSLTFKDGEIVGCSAERGYEVLKNLIATDTGSHYLGEVALVPFDSPISQLNILFYNTLFDENASCHLAIGQAYPTCIENGENMSKEELEVQGVNDSLVHVDFMIGTKDLKITGIAASGQEMPVFKDGNFAF